MFLRKNRLQLRTINWMQNFQWCGMAPKTQGWLGEYIAQSILYHEYLSMTSLWPCAANSSTAQNHIVTLFLVSLIWLLTSDNIWKCLKQEKQHHKISLMLHSYICSNSQKYIVWVKMIDFSFMPNIIRILSKDHVPWIYIIHFLL